MTKLDLSDRPEMQDIIKIIMERKGLSEVESIAFSINRDISDRILTTGWASIALPLWGHGDPKREWEMLDKPIIEIEFDELKQSLINEIIEKENINIETAISYCLLFTVESLGYHI